MDADLTQIARRLTLPVPVQVLEGKLPDVANACRFEGLKVHRESRFATAGRRVSGGSPAMGTWTKELTLFLEWEPAGAEVQVMIAVYDASVGRVKIPDLAARDQVADALRRLAQLDRSATNTETV